jgi:hypothetical protein
MKFSIALFAILSAVPTAVEAGAMKTCADQVDCLQFTTTEQTHSACGTGDCEFKICMKLQLGGSCDKSASDTVSHTCEKDEAVCLDVNGGFSSAAETVGIPNGYESCQTVKLGGAAEFLMKDGNGVCGAIGVNGDDSLETKSCQALEDVYDVDGSCTGNVGTECIWIIQAPDSCADSTSDSDGDGVTETDPDTTSLSAAEEDAYLCS